MAKIVQKMLKVVMLKSCKTIPLIEKLYSNLFSNPSGGFLALEGTKSKKNDKNFQKKLEKKILSKHC